MSYEEAFKKAQAEGKFLRRDAWSMGRPSIIFENGQWLDAYGRPFVWSNADLNAQRDADDWMVLGSGA